MNEKCVVKVIKADTNDLKDLAFHRLIVPEYKKIGRPNPNRDYTPLLNRMKDGRTETYILMRDGSPVGTISVSSDVRGKLLPCEEDFPDEFAMTRAEFGSVVLVGLFATDDEEFKKLQNLCMSKTILWLFGKILEFGFEHHVNGLICVVNPGTDKRYHEGNKKHSSFYKRIGFRQLGPIRKCKGVDDADGVFMRVNIDNVIAKLMGPRDSDLSQRLTGLIFGAAGVRGFENEIATQKSVVA
jgi:hypothetical protein